MDIIKYRIAQDMIKKEIWQTPDNISLKYDEINFKTKDGFNISGWYIPAENEKGVLLFCHGNA